MFYIKRIYITEKMRAEKIAAKIDSHGASYTTSSETIDYINIAIDIYKT